METPNQALRSIELPSPPPIETAFQQFHALIGQSAATLQEQLRTIARRYTDFIYIRNALGLTLKLPPFMFRVMPIPLLFNPWKLAGKPTWQYLDNFVTSFLTGVIGPGGRVRGYEWGGRAALFMPDAGTGMLFYPFTTDTRTSFSDGSLAIFLNLGDDASEIRGRAIYSLQSYDCSRVRYALQTVLEAEILMQRGQCAPERFQDLLKQLFSFVPPEQEFSSSGIDAPLSYHDRMLLCHAAGLTLEESTSFVRVWEDHLAQGSSGFERDPLLSPLLVNYETGMLPDNSLSPWRLVNEDIRSETRAFRFLLTAPDEELVDVTALGNLRRRMREVSRLLEGNDALWDSASEAARKFEENLGKLF